MVGQTTSLNFDRLKEISFCLGGHFSCLLVTYCDHSVGSLNGILKFERRLYFSCCEPTKIYIIKKQMRYFRSVKFNDISFDCLTALPLLLHTNIIMTEGKCRKQDSCCLPHYTTLSQYVGCLVMFWSVSVC